MVFCGINVSKSRLFETKIITLKKLVVFRLVVFRPFTSEVIVAKVKSSDENGVRREIFKYPLIYAKSSNMPTFSVTVGFFDDMYIPTAFLPQPSALYVSYTASHFPIIIVPESSQH
jgi:DNA-directed RNA polymerase subunit E'/Rpb7